MNSVAIVINGKVMSVEPEVVTVGDMDFPLADRIPAEMLKGAVSITSEQATTIRPGWEHDGSSFKPPEVMDSATVPESPATRTVSTLEFRQRFTREEIGAVTLAASKALDGGQPALQVWLDDIRSAGMLDLDSPDVLSGMSLIVDAKLMTRARANKILGV